MPLLHPPVPSSTVRAHGWLRRFLAGIGFMAHTMPLSRRRRRWQLMHDFARETREQGPNGHPRHPSLDSRPRAGEADACPVEATR